MEWMILPFKRYFDFKGRSRRKELWMYTLFIVLVSIALSILDVALGLGGSAEVDSDTTATSAAASGALSGGLLTNLFSLATLIPSLSVSVRRLHDLDRTGWWILLPFGPMIVGAVIMGVGFASQADASSLGGMAGTGIALIGVGVLCSILLLVWYCMPGTAGPNRFGEDPKGVHTDAEEVFG